MSKYRYQWKRSRLATRHLEEHHLSGGSLKVPRTSLDRLHLEVKRARLKREAEIRREEAAGG